MTHGRQHFTGDDALHIGQDATLDILVEDASGADVDMSGGDVTFTIMPIGQRDEATSVTTPLVEKSVGSGITITDAATGELEVRFEPADTTDIDEQTAWYRIDVTDSGGQTVPGAAAGQFEFTYD